MISKLKFISLLFITGIFIFSCTKHHDDTSVTPPLLDTLGAGWQSIKINDTLNLEDIFFVNPQTGFVCGDKYLGKSTDGGLTWKKCIPDSLNDSFVNLYFADANNGWAFGGVNFSLRTKDGGSSWQKINRGGIYDGQFFDADNGYITSNTNGTSPGLYKTSDGGATFQYLNASPGAGAGSGLFFLDQNKGWVSNFYLNKTENAGLSFVQFAGKFPGPNGGEYAIQFIDELHGWTGGVNGIFRTVDGGITLENLTPGTIYSSGDIQFFDLNNGFILRDKNIYSTTDGGTTLNNLCTIYKSTVFEIHFADPGHGWAAGSNGYVYRYVKP